MIRLSLIIIGLSALFACTNTSPENRDKTISVSILPQKYFVSSITGPAYHINVMVPPGASPEIYEAGFRQLNELANSSIYLKSGFLGFEDVWMKSIADLNPDLKIYDSSEGLPLLEQACEHDHEGHHHKEHHHDPHVWMSVSDAAIIARNTLQALLKAFPEDSSVFIANYQQLSAEIDSVKAAYQASGEILKGKSFIIYHPALSYLAHEFDMEQIAIEYEGKEPPPSHLKNIIEKTAEFDKIYILIQKQFNPDNANSIAAETGAEIVQIDPLNENWKEEMLSLLDILIVISENQ